MSMIEDNQIEIYNEFSLQHELGIFLREQLPNYKVQFERNTKDFGIKGTIKHEIDIVVYNDKEKYNYSYVQWYENAISVDKVFSELNSYETKNGYLSFTISYNGE